jgi:hypothetical protein
MMKTATNKPANKPKTFSEWAAWLSEQEQKSFNAYRAKPELLIADGIRERESTRDYEGREILELLQNANDAAAENGDVSSVVIELHAQGLIVANTGHPFSTEGVTSLQTANLSPKRRNRKSFIGNKGLGFRAVLNWTQSPIIVSGDLRLVFGRCHAQEKVSELKKTSPALADLVLKELDEGEFAYPVLTFPKFSQDGNIFPFIPDQPTQEIFARCETLQKNGYTTVIGMPFDQLKAVENAVGQLSSLTPELLLFVKNLGEITINKLSGTPVRWQRKAVQNTVKVSISDRPDEEWEVRSETKSIPAEYLVKDKGKVTEYEIVVAIPKVRQSSVFPLFSYFPTNVTFPLPLVCHATLELEQNRKHPQGGGANRFVLQRLASFIAETVEHYSKEHPDQPWAGYDLLNCTKDFGADLNQIEFKRHLLAATATKLICPTISGAMVTPKTGKLMFKGASDEWLPAKGFDDVIRCRDQSDWDFLQSMSPDVLTPVRIKERLLGLTGLTLDQRAALVAGLVEHAPSSVHSPALLLDINGNQIPEDSRVFLSSSGGPTAKLPPWMEVRFLNEELRKSLSKKLGCNDTREVQNRLATFRVAE